MNKVVIIGVATAAIIAIATLVRYYTRTGVFKGRKNKDSKKPDNSNNNEENK